MKPGFVGTTPFNSARKAASIGDWGTNSARLMTLRALIFDVAAKTDGVGALDETLKWGEPAYLTRSKSGSTIRLGWKASAPDEAGSISSARRDWWTASANSTHGLFASAPLLLAVPVQDARLPS